MYPYGDYYIVVEFHELAGETHTYFSGATFYTDRLQAESQYHAVLSGSASAVKTGLTMTTAGAMLLKGNGAILAKETFYNREVVDAAVESLMNNSEENN